MGGSKRQILVIGTFHDYQRNTPGYNRRCESPKFKCYVEQIVDLFGVGFSFEEMSEDALRKSTGYSTRPGDRWDSWLEVVGREKRIGHKFIDAGFEDRKKLGIPPDGSMSEEEEGTLREGFWLERIMECDFTTAICVVGARHVPSFVSRLSAQFETRVVDPDYNPMGFVHGESVASH